MLANMHLEVPKISMTCRQQHRRKRETRERTLDKRKKIITPPHLEHKTLGNSLLLWVAPPPCGMQICGAMQTKRRAKMATASWQSWNRFRANG